MSVRTVRLGAPALRPTFLEMRLMFSAYTVLLCLTALDRKLADTDSEPWCGVQIIDLDTGACVIPPEDIHTQAPNPEAGHEEEIPPPPPALNEESNVSPR